MLLPPRSPWLHPHTRALPTPPAPMQDAAMMLKVGEYFNRTIRELEWDDEDAFLKVLEESM